MISSIIYNSSCKTKNILVFFFTKTPTQAAVPDGSGPWADSVVSASQANTKSGTPVSVVNPARSDPTSALGIAENDTVDSHFFSLGFGGSITLGFDNGIKNGVFVVEATNPNYPLEKAKVELSENGTTWVMAGTVTQDGTVTKPDSLTCVKYARISDISNPDEFSEDTADVYDLDGVKAEGDPCEPPTSTPTTCGCNTNVTQTNTTNVSVSGIVVANAGGIKAKKNNGNVNIVTGNATNNVNINVGGNTNTLTGSGCGCDCGGNTNVVISNNGPGSTNIVRINKFKVTIHSFPKPRHREATE